MPANLPPQYFEAEKRYREAKTPQEKIEALEEMLTIMPKHKGTDKLRADLRRKISKFKTQAQQKKGAGKRETAYSIEREGAAQILLVGPPNTGKSSLVRALTNATPDVADFPHSTWKPTPGMVSFENIQFQLVDTPPITREYVDPWM
ncbi:MAG TPA: GTP-binding protein, partial [Desulfobacterales bacterium]|nr:GTP-binding protein [Desulfobacterales bacterium]